ncbi:group XV phospholipase A2-like [Planoprotostelium fungivorum]|uniref:Group XV phospholipase A2-like n=1 Tax=Planoprotostelium fungivorum TaxID=1890364 RepID=A0A2P6NYH1_9EUKA|nr:group XV phospholipase A2-like [Planoprotostelium fungivorum]
MRSAALLIFFVSIYCCIGDPYNPPETDPNYRWHACDEIIEKREVNNKPIPSTSGDSQQRHPILLVPGYSGTSLDISRDGTENDSNDECLEYADMGRLWLNWKFLSPLRSSEFVNCFFRLFSLQVSVINGSISYSPQVRGVKVKPSHDVGEGERGGTDAVDELVKVFGGGVGGYMNSLITSLEGRGYTRGVDLFAAPYDWRVSPDFLFESMGYREKMTRLVEDMYKSSGKRVVLISHSMGNLHTLRFLNEMSGEWKDKFIEHYFSIAAPWAGVPNTVKDILSGDLILKGWYAEYVKLFDRDRAQNFGSLVFMNPPLSIWQSTTLVRFQDGSNFTTSQLPYLYELSCTSPSPSIIRKSVEKSIDRLSPPLVETTCMLGYGVNTERYWEYKDAVSTSHGWADIIGCGDGDGTVSIESNAIARYWEREYGEVNGGREVEVREYYGRDHLGMVSDEEVLGDITAKLSIINGRS